MSFRRSRRYPQEVSDCDQSRVRVTPSRWSVGKSAPVGRTPKEDTMLLTGFVTVSSVPTLSHSTGILAPDRRLFRPRCIRRSSFNGFQTFHPLDFVWRWVAVDPFVGRDSLTTVIRSQTVVDVPFPRLFSVSVVCTDTRTTGPSSGKTHLGP